MNAVIRKIPTFIVLTACVGLFYRKFLWCRVLLPAPGEPYGLGDLVEIVPVFLLLVLCGAGVVSGFIFLVSKRLRDLQYGIALICLSLVSYPLYQKIYSEIRPSCKSAFKSSSM